MSAPIRSSLSSIVQEPVEQCEVVHTRENKRIGFVTKASGEVPQSQYQGNAPKPRGS
jgi:hypothetical protein